MSYRRPAVISCALFLATTPAFAQRPKASPSPAPARAEAPAPPSFDGLKFREIGPATPSGRIDDFAVIDSDPSTFYVASATGSVWKTTNRGTTFTAVFDKEATSSVGDIATAPNDPNLLWVGTGENNNRQSSSWGEGVFKSTDGGKTFTNMGLKASRHIARILVDPVDHDVVYVAALGSLWGPGGERGVFKTSDGGLTWTNVLKTDANTGATELVMDPRNNKVIYAATYQRQRQPWGMNGGGEGSAIHKTTDAGRTWTKLTKGIPEGAKGRIGLDIWRKDPNVVYARIEHEKESGVYRSDDAGASWRKLSSTNPRPMYFSQIRIDPQDDSRVYVLGVSLSVSDDGGKTFRDDGASKIHVDFHAMWVDPNNPDHVMIGGDGGVGISYDRSRTYQWLANLNLGQFYHVHYDLKSPYTVCGGLQDNNTWCGPSAIRNKDGIGNDEWFIVQGGDGFQASLDPSDARIIYAESQDGNMSRIDRLTNERQSIRPEPKEGEKPYRWNWDTPLVLSPHDPKTVYAAANMVFRSGDRGLSWTAVSPDLTNAVERDEREIMGIKGKDTKIAKHDGVTVWGTLVSFAESTKRAGLLYTGSDDGVVAVSKDAGATWTRVTDKIPGVPKETYVSEVVPSRFEEGRVYVTFDGHRGNDFNAYAFVSPDFGATWKSIVSNLPKGEVVRTLTEDLKNPDVLYLGTETGLFVSTDSGGSWIRVRANLPTVPIYEITLHPRDNAMILATHGRSLWILDDLTPFQAHAKAAAVDAMVFEPEVGVTRNSSSERMREFEGDLKFLGQNPPAGTPITYRLKSETKDVKLSITDAAGKIVRELTGDAMKDAGKAGINTVVWDLRVAPLPAVRGPQGGGGGGGFGGGGNNGPMVLPSTYAVTLSAAGKELAKSSVTVTSDPEVAISDDDLRARFDTLTRLHDLGRKANEAYNALYSVNEQLNTVKDKIKAPSVAADLKAAVDEFEKEMAAVRPRLGLPAPGTVPGGGGGFDPEAARRNVRQQLSGLKGQIMGATMRPTDTQMRRIDENEKALGTVIESVNAVLPKASALFAKITAAGLLFDVPKPLR